MTNNANQQYVDNARNPSYKEHVDARRERRTLFHQYRPGTMIRRTVGYGPTLGDFRSAEKLYVVIGWRWMTSSPWDPLNPLNGMIDTNNLGSINQEDCELLMLPFGPGPLEVLRCDEVNRVTVLVVVK